MLVPFLLVISLGGPDLEPERTINLLDIILTMLLLRSKLLLMTKQTVQADGSGERTVMNFTWPTADSRHISV